MPALKEKAFCILAANSFYKEVQPAVCSAGIFPLCSKTVEAVFRAALFDMGKGLCGGKQNTLCRIVVPGGFLPGGQNIAAGCENYARGKVFVKWQAAGLCRFQQMAAICGKNSFCLHYTL